MPIERKWFITEFANVVNERAMKENMNHKNVHYNTFDVWFKIIENKRIHYVQREMSRKAYDETDLKLALVIIEKRQLKWNFSMIHQYIQCLDYLRPFPKQNEQKNMKENSSYSIPNVDPIMIKMFIDEAVSKALNNMLPNIENTVQTISQNVFKDINNEVIEDLKQLTSNSITRSSKELQYNVEQYVRASLTTSRIQLVKNVVKLIIALEDEAIAEWNSQTRQKNRLFHQEDILKRDQFIRHFMQKQIEDAKENNPY